MSYICNFTTRGFDYCSASTGRTSSSLRSVSWCGGLSRLQILRCRQFSQHCVYRCHYSLRRYGRKHLSSIAGALITSAAPGSMEVVQFLPLSSLTSVCPFAALDSMQLRRKSASATMRPLQLHGFTDDPPRRATYTLNRLADVFSRRAQEYKRLNVCI